MGVYKDEDLIDLFKFFDVNQDGVICKEDMKDSFANMKEYQSDIPISNMIEHFNHSGYAEPVILESFIGWTYTKIGIKFSTFKSIVSSKIKNLFTEEDLRTAFQEVVKISDGIRIIGTDNKQEIEKVDIETIIEALNSEVLDHIGNLDNVELKVILDEMARDGHTQGLTYEEFSYLIKSYAKITDCFIMFGALLTRNHKEVNNCEYALGQEDGIRVLNTDGTLANSSSYTGGFDASKPVVECETPKRKLENTHEVAETLTLEEKQIDTNDLISTGCPEKQAKTDLI